MAATSEMAQMYRKLYCAGTPLEAGAPLTMFMAISLPCRRNKMAFLGDTRRETQGARALDFPTPAHVAFLLRPQVSRPFKSNHRQEKTPKIERRKCRKWRICQKLENRNRKNGKSSGAERSSSRQTGALFSSETCRQELLFNADWTQERVSSPAHSTPPSEGMFRCRAAS
jgi:hypothetical protein